MFGERSEAKERDRSFTIGRHSYNLETFGS